MKVQHAINFSRALLLRSNNPLAPLLCVSYTKTTMNIFVVIWWIVFALLAILFIAGILRTQNVHKSANQKKFLAGKVPDPLLNGFYRGQANGYAGPWQGKSFDKKRKMGGNIFKNGVREMKKFPFKTYVGKGLQDKNLDVFKIDYDIPENSFWVRMILDEIVEVEKEKYLGKIHLRFLPGIPFTVGYFTLEK